ncbi:MAG: acylphosphatase [Dehalococcoidia bacterium]|nr:MAG: acylphosphatase [Dehalococcoidia bacterium]
MAEPAALKVIVTGQVQGVMFRDYTRRQAERLSLGGYVRNLPGGRTVEIEAEGERAQLKELLKMVKRGPPRAVVESVSPTWGKYTGRYQDFSITF